MEWHSHVSHGHDGSAKMGSLWLSLFCGLASLLVLANRMLNGSGVKIFTGTLAMSAEAEAVTIVHDEQAPVIQSWRKSSLGGTNPGIVGLHILNEF